MVCGFSVEVGLLSSNRCVGDSSVWVRVSCCSLLLDSCRLCFGMLL